jgi:hypothetical protein
MEIWIILFVAWCLCIIGLFIAMMKHLMLLGEIEKNIDEINKLLEGVEIEDSNTE